MCHLGRVDGQSGELHSPEESGVSVLIQPNLATGSIAGSSAFRGALPNKAVLEDITQGSDGSVFVTGYGSDPTLRFVTFKYARSNGAIRWGPVYYEVPEAYFGYPYEVRTDSAGDVYVLGAANGTVVLKYNGATGAQLWFSELTDVYPAFLAVDASGDVFVLTQKYNNTDPDFATLKLSGATGAILWGPVPFDGESGSGEYPKFLSVTPGGDAVVTGVSVPDSLFRMNWPWTPTATRSSRAIHATRNTTTTSRS